MGAARPHGALDAGAALQNLQRALDEIGLGQLAHADRQRLGDRDLETHLVFLELDHEEFELVARNFLFLDRGNLAYAMRRIDDELVGLETLPLRRFLRGNRHALLTPSRVAGRNPKGQPTFLFSPCQHARKRCDRSPNSVDKTYPIDYRLQRRSFIEGASNSPEA